MVEILRKAFDKSDGFIILAAIILLANFGYENLSTSDKVCIVSLGLWAVLKLIRIYIVYSNEKKG